MPDAAYRTAGPPEATRLGLGTLDVGWDLLSEQINDLVIVAGANGVIAYASPASRLLGYEPHELIGRTGEDFIHPDDLAHFQANGAALFSGDPVNRDADREHRFRRKDGSWRWLEGSPSLIPGPHGMPIGVLNVFRDVTDKRAIRQALSEQTRRAAMAEDLAGIGYWQLEPATGAVTWSEQMFRNFGLEPGGKPGLKGAKTKVHPADAAASKARLAAAISSGEGWSNSLTRIVRPDGEIRYLDGRGSCEKGADGRVTFVFGTIVDVTEHETLKAKLKEALAEAEKLAAVKSEFLANMSHEIRTPLTAVLGFTGLLAERPDLDPIAQTYVERIAGAGRSLLAIVNDVLDFSALEAGLATITPRPTAPAAVCREVLEMFGLQAGAKAIELRFEAASDVPETVSIDPDRLRQILINLIGNAVKFTDCGSVGVKVGYDRGAGRLAIDVADTGPGIAADARAKLFRRFSQIDGSSTRAKGGTGLGLAICEGLAQAMEGSVSVRSRLGRGTTFSVSLPAPPTVAAEPSEAPGGVSDDLEGLRVLVVDDNASNRELARAVLEGAGVEVTQAENGQVAVELAGRLPVDLILMDIRMPGMNGRDAASAIRDGDGPNRDVPILAFSADTDSAPPGTGEPSAFTGWVGKPMSPAQLLEAVGRAVSDDPVSWQQEMSHVVA